jgi:hypothetical protein
VGGVWVFVQRWCVCSCNGQRVLWGWGCALWGPATNAGARPRRRQEKHSQQQPS